MEDINVWIFPIQEQILITDQTGGVPVDVCNLAEHYSQKLEQLTGSKSVLYQFNDWGKAVEFATTLQKEKLKGWAIEYDNWVGRSVEAEQNGDNDYCHDDYSDEDGDWDLDDDEDDFENALDECGQLPDGGCMLAGTEFCDWDCPI